MPSKTARKSMIRIANAGGYWGDDPAALERQVNGGPLDYITIDFLAEVTMSIMQKQRARDPKAGYAADFISAVKKVLPALLKNKTKLITNAGGVNPEGCAAAVAQAAKELGLEIKIAVVLGDDILTDLESLRAKGASFKNMETGEDFAATADHIEAANVYFGAVPVAEALKSDPDIVITGRVTDTGITLAAMLHEFSWPLDDWDRLASGIIAGHMIECGAQVTGGNFTDWKKVKSFHNIGYPIVEVHEDGHFILTKHPNSGGLVNVDTVREQVFYEMGDPKAYITPDVIADFSSIKLAADGPDRVKVWGIRGSAPTAFYKVSMAYADGFKSMGSILICGPEARAKAEAFADIFWQRANVKNFAEVGTEFFGWNACQRSMGLAADGAEILLKLSARSKDEGALKKFGKLIPTLILSGPPGVAVTGGVPKPQEVVTYWPALLDKALVTPRVARFENGLKDERLIDPKLIARGEGTLSTKPDDVCQTASKSIEQVYSAKNAGTQTHPLSSICLGRSGDKGDTCNVGILARGPEAYQFLDELLTAERIKNWYQELALGKVTKFRLPGLLGFNFLLEEALGGGGTVTFRSDAQGKTFAQALLRQEVVIPEAVLRSAKAWDPLQAKLG